MTGYLATAYAGLGQKDVALRIAKGAVNACPISSDSIDSVNCIDALAAVYAMTGDPESALNELAKIVILPGGPTYGDLRFNPGWDKLRQDSRFATLLNQAAIPRL